MAMKRPLKFDTAFEHFLDDLAGFLNKYQRGTRKSWNVIAGETLLAHRTVTAFARRQTRNPQSYTIWKLLRRLDCSPSSFSGKFRSRSNARD